MGFFVALYRSNLVAIIIDFMVQYNEISAIHSSSPEGSFAPARASYFMGALVAQEGNLFRYSTVY